MSESGRGARRCRSYYIGSGRVRWENQSTKEFQQQQLRKEVSEIWPTWTSKKQQVIYSTVRDVIVHNILENVFNGYDISSSV